MSALIEYGLTGCGCLVGSTWLYLTFLYSEVIKPSIKIAVGYQNPVSNSASLYFLEVLASVGSCT